MRSSASVSASSASCSSIGGVAGQGQEDVVERRAAQADVVDVDARLRRGRGRC